MSEWSVARNPGSVTITAKSLDEIIEAERERDALREEIERLKSQRDVLVDALEAVDWTNQRAAVQVKIGSALRLAGFPQEGRTP